MIVSGLLPLVAPVLMCLVVLFIIYTFCDYETGTVNGNARLVGGPQAELRKRDCDTEIVYSVTDSQCHDVCRQPNVFVSRNGACVNVLAFSAHDESNECDPRRGVLAFLIGDPQFGKTALRCFSVDPGIQPDDPTGKNIICNHGAIDIDYVESFPQAAACRCTTDPARGALASVANTRVMRAYGVCVSDNMKRLFRYDGLLLDSEARKHKIL